METVTCDQAFLQSLANKTNTCLLYPKKLSKMQLIQNATVWQIISYNTVSWHLLKLHPSRDENVSLLLKGIEGNKSLKFLPLFLKRLFGYFYLSMPLNLWQMRWMVPGYTHYAHTWFKSSASLKITFNELIFSKNTADEGNILHNFCHFIDSWNFISTPVIPLGI